MACLLAAPVFGQPGLPGSLPTPGGSSETGASVDAGESAGESDGDGAGEGASSVEAGSSDPASTVPASVEEVEARQAALVDEIESWGARVSESGVVSRVGAEADRVDEVVLDLAQLVLGRLDAQAGVLRQLAEARRVDEVAPSAPSTLDPLALPEAGDTDEATELGFDELDPILDRRDSAAQAVELAEEEIVDTRRSLDRAESLARSRGQDRRRLAEAGERAVAPDGIRQAEKALLEAIWRERLAAEEVRLEHLRLRAAEQAAELARAELEHFERQALFARARLRPTTEGLDRALSAVERETVEHRERLAGLETELQATQERWSEAIEAVQALGTRDAEEASEDEETAAETRERSLRRALELLETERQIRVARLEALASHEEVVRLRYAAVGIEREDDTRRKERLETLRARTRDLDRRTRASERIVEEVRNRHRLTEGRHERAIEGSSAAARRWSERELELSSSTLELARELRERNRTSWILAQRALAETDTEQVQARDWLGDAVRSLNDLWRWELTAVDDRPVTLGKIFLALLLVLFGYLTSKRLSAALASALGRRFSVSSGAAHALQNLVFYLLVVIFFLWAFQLVGIPLGVFTLLGGVLAIGLGFGSQNVVNNFISGLILLIERPIKVGDLIDVDGVLGKVERIGLRSTRVRPGDNTHIFVPNSSFLEKSVLNWTGTDELIRISVDVGVAYGSPVATVRELLERAAREEERVLTTPAPEVLFMDFADSALVFRTYFWSRVRAGLDPPRVQSALRFRIDELFAEAGIVIAFPQRDLHLDTLPPLRVELHGSGRRADRGESNAPETTAPETNAPETTSEAAPEEPAKSPSGEPGERST